MQPNQDEKNYKAEPFKDFAVWYEAKGVDEKD